MAWLRPLHYEVNIDDVTNTIIALIDEIIDKNVKPFSTYEIAKIKMMMETKVPKMDRKRKKTIQDLEGKLEESHEEEGKGK